MYQKGHQSDQRQYYWEQVTLHIPLLVSVPTALDDWGFAERTLFSHRSATYPAHSGRGCYSCYGMCSLMLQLVPHEQLLRVRDHDGK